MMRSLIAASIVLALAPTVAFAAAQQDVVDQCGTGSIACADTAATYVADISATGRPDAIVNLTLALVNLAQKDPACNDVDRAAAAAIRRLATFSDTAQAVRLNEIADTLLTCSVTNTAAIASGLPGGGGAGSPAPGAEPATGG
jgi:hypothetical protein